MSLGFVEKIKQAVGKDKDTAQYFLSLAISYDSVEACVWLVNDNQTQILASSIANYQQIDDLQIALGQSIDQAIDTAGVDVSKVIYGLPEDWIEDEKVIAPYASILKQLSKDLSFEPLAFVSTVKALTHLMYQQEKTPLDGILVGIFSKTLTFAHVASGKIYKSKVLGRIDTDIKKPMVEALKDLSKDQQLPSRIIIYGSGADDENLTQTTTINWDEIKTEDNSKNVFLHPPKVDRLETGSMAKAVSYAGATDLGFPAPTAVITRPQEAQTSTDFGFVEGQDILNEDKNMQPVFEESDYQEPVSLKNVGLSWTSFFIDFISGRGKVVFLIGGIAIISLVILVFAYWFFPKATLQLKLKTQPLPDTQAEIIASPNFDRVNEESGQIPAQIIESNQNGSQKAVTSGKKQVGEKAKGKVVVYNKTSAPRSFDSGTQIASSGGLKFSFLSSITVASRSATIEGITFGKAEVETIAVQAGADSNLSSGQEFKIADFDTSLFVARNDQSFSGGSSKEISIVSQEDQSRLEKTLLSDLTEKAKLDINAKLSGNQKLLDKAIAAKAKSKKFDQGVGDESPVLTLNMEIDFKATVFSSDDLNFALASYTKSSLPDGFELVAKDDQTVADVAELAPNGDLVFQAKLQGVLIPKINIEDLKKQLSGKKPEAVKEHLATISEVVGSELILKPPLPGFLKRIPYRNTNIEIVTLPE